MTFEFAAIGSLWQIDTSVELPAAVASRLIERVNALTMGAMDPLVGRDLEVLGYDRSYRLRPDLHAVLALATALAIRTEALSSARAATGGRAQERYADGVYAARGNMGTSPRPSS